MSIRTPRTHLEAPELTVLAWTAALLILLVIGVAAVWLLRS